MIIDIDQHPEKTVFWIGGKQLELITDSQTPYDSVSLFEKYNGVFPIKISFSYHLLGLDWLFLIELIKTNKKGEIVLCNPIK